MPLDPSLPTYTGTVVLHNGAFRQESGPPDVISNFTYTLTGTGSDGSTFETHITGHTNIPPEAPINEFFRCI